MKRRVVATLAAVTALAVVGVAGATTADAGVAAGPGFVTRKGADLLLNGKKFQFAGTNNYYLMYSSPLMVDAMLGKAAASDFQVVRAWGSFEIGRTDYSDTVDPGARDKGVYFQYFDPATGAPAFNDGDNGLRKLDYVVAKASALGLKMVFPLVNNWRDFGGMDQYVKWRGASFHDDFYTDPVIKGWYKAWISHLLNRVNSITGVAYRNDPTIMTWELGNEPRCKGTGVFPTSANCSTTVITAWADEMTRHIRSIDRNHLRSVGDEGFYCISPSDPDWTRNCGEGVDDKALIRLPAVDVMSFHIYPDYWGKDLAWSKQWILDHVRDARQAGKAVMWGEYGWQNKATRNTVYQDWLQTFLLAGGNGALYWILSDLQDNGSLYPDYDGFTVYCPSPVCTNITNFAHFFAGDFLPLPGPVADHDNVVTEFNTPATVAPLANDIAYVGDVRANTTDLDPATAGRQTSVTVPGGAFALDAAAQLTFTPNAGFVGRASANYTVKDLLGKVSNVATVTVTVKPDPNATQILFSFEDGTQGWGLPDWQAGSGTTSQTTAFHTDGAAGLHVQVTSGAWFWVSFDATGSLLDLTGKFFLKYEMTGDSGFGTLVAVQAGPSYNWCQVTGTNFTGGGATTTIEFDLAGIQGCDPGGSGVSQIHAMYLWFNPGNYDLDAVRVE